ncbi:hypothetical protein C8F01DRAFT_1174000 [Mycena amicta]|nr:hypothetical protein C8F01DRAFT_1174000 [Mycena amicta]
MSYLGFRYVGESTKVAVLKDLEWRIREFHHQFRGDIHQVTNSLCAIHSDIVYDLLASPNRQIKHGICNVLRHICVQEYRFPANFYFRCATILISTPFNTHIRFPRLNVLAGLCYSTHGAEAVSDALVTSAADASQVEEVLWFTVSLLIQDSDWTTRDLRYKEYSVSSAVLAEAIFLSGRMDPWLSDIIDQGILVQCAIKALHQTLTRELTSIDFVDLLRCAPTIMRRGSLSPSPMSLSGEFADRLNVLVVNNCTSPRTLVSTMLYPFSFDLEGKSA